MTLTEAALKAAAPREKAYQIKGEDALYADIRPTGKVVFRVRYWFHQRETRVTLGEFPALRLREAREMCAEIRRKLARREDPRDTGQAAPDKRDDLPTFSDIAREWLAKAQAETKSVKYRDNLKMYLEKHILPRIGEMPISEITPRVILDGIVRPIEEEKHSETAHRVVGVVGRVFRFAIASDRAQRDPTRDLIGALVVAPLKHHPSITDRRRWGALLSAIHHYDGSFVVREAMKLLYLTFLRPGELRQAEWSEFDLNARQWKIPPEKMKMKRPHVVPLSRQAIELVQKLVPITGKGRYLFPSARSYTGTRALSDGAINTALRTLLVNPNATPHHKKSAHRWRRYTSDGVLYPKHFRGVEFIRSVARIRSASLTLRISEPFGNQRRRRPFVFSFVPRSHGLYGCAK